ncbi:MAG: CoA pyrophosphatase [Acidobacteriota bacterium]
MKQELQRKPIQAASLIPVYRREDGDVGLVVVRRTPWGVHGGQLAFPGGKYEEEDGDLLETAVRESREEVGLARKAIHVLEELPPLETWTTGFVIHPFLARIERPAEWCKDDREIAQVLEIGLRDLARPDAHGEDLVTFPTWPGPRRIPYYRVGPYKLWGASYRIFHPLLPRLLSGEWEI